MSDNDMQRPPLSPEGLDQMMTPKGKLWGLDTIAGYLGMGKDKVRRLARQGHAPIYKPAGQGSYLAFRNELDAWLRERWQRTTPGGGHRL